MKPLVTFAKSDRPGLTVMLASGGPRMTVASVEGDNTFCHYWDDIRQTFFQKVLPASALVVLAGTP